MKLIKYKLKKYFPEIAIVLNFIALVFVLRNEIITEIYSWRLCSNDLFSVFCY